MAFDVFDSDRDGALTRRELWKFMRSFLTAILNFARVDGGANEVNGAIVEACAAVFDRVGQEKGEMVGVVSFDEFGEWYNSCGSAVVPWLELLDMGKWPAVNSDAEALRAQEEGEEEEEEEEELAEEEELGEEELAEEEEEFAEFADRRRKELAAQPPLAPAEQEGRSAAVPLFATAINDFGDWMEVHEVDVENMRTLVSATKLLNMVFSIFFPILLSYLKSI